MGLPPHAILREALRGGPLSGQATQRDVIPPPGMLREGPHSYGPTPALVAQVGILGVLQLTIVITGPNPHRRVALVRIMRTPRSLTLA